MDIPYHYLKFFLDDDEKLKQIGDDYGSGKMLSGEVKKILIGLLVGITKEHQEKRKEVTEEIVDVFMSVRKF